MENEKIIKYKKLLIILSGVALIISIFAAFYFYQQQKGSVGQNEPNTGLVKKDEVQAIKNENSRALTDASHAAIQTVAPINNEDHFQGILAAPVQIIVYGDFDCPFCAEFYDTIKEIQKNFSDKTVIAFRHFPLTTHSLAVPAALASECAGEQGKFWEMYEKLYTENKSGNLNSEQFKQDAADLKMDTEQFNKCLDSQKYKDKIEAQMTAAKNFGVTGTPASFINSQPLPGAYPYEDFTDSQGDNQSGVKTIITKILETSDSK